MEQALKVILKNAIISGITYSSSIQSMLRILLSTMVSNHMSKTRYCSLYKFYTEILSSYKLKMPVGSHSTKPWSLEKVVKVHMMNKLFKESIFYLFVFFCCYCLLLKLDISNQPDIIYIFIDFIY